MKKKWADSWSSEVLEEVAASCSIASNAQTESDWELFLNAVYEAANFLPERQREILLLSQEHSLSFSDIGRVFNMPHSTVLHNFKKAVESMVQQLTDKSVLNTKLREESYVAQQLYDGKFHPEEHCEKTRNGFYYDYEPPCFFTCVNPLMAEESG